MYSILKLQREPCTKARECQPPSMDRTVAGHPGGQAQAKGRVDNNTNILGNLARRVAR